MSELSTIERRRLERLFDMESGYILDFSNRTFSEFFDEHFKLDIENQKYKGQIQN